MGLTKKQIKTVKADVLNTRYCWLMKKGEELPADEFSIAEAREMLWIEDELHRRLLKYLGRDPYPPDKISRGGE